MRRSPVIAALTLAAYAAGALVVPVLHRVHHARFGADHVHAATGTIYFAHAPLDGGDGAAHHAAFDADLAALGLTDVAHAGTLAVDCALAEITLASCPTSLAGHPHGFGDELLARTHRHPAPAPLDPGHGRGAPEHLMASLLGTRAFVLSPPSLPVSRYDLAFAFVARPSTPSRAPSCRGPPARG